MRTFKMILSALLVAFILAGTASCSCSDNKGDTKATTTAITTAKATVKTTAPTTVATTTPATSADNGDEKSNDSSLPALPDIYNNAKDYGHPKDEKRPSDDFIASLNGYTLKIKHPWNMGINATDKNALMNVGGVAEVKEKYGATIEETGVFDDYNKILLGEIKANKFTNQMYEVQSFNFASYIKNNYMKDLTTAKSIAKVSFNEAWYNYDVSQITSIDGAQYGFMAFNASYTMPQGILYNKKILKSANLADPINLARSGKWTWDKFEEYALKLNSSSVTGFRLGTKEGSEFFSSLMSSQGTDLATLTKGSSPKSNVLTQAGKEALKQIQTWVSKKAITLNENEVWDVNKKLFSEGKVAMTLASHDTVNQCKGENMRGNMGIVPFPNKTASKKYRDVLNLVFISFIPSYYKDDNDVAKMLFLRDEQLQNLYGQREFVFLNTYKQFGFDANTMNLAYLIQNGLKDTSGAVYSKHISAENILDPDGSDVDGTPSLTRLVLPVFKGSAASTQISSKGSVIQEKYNSMWKNKVFTGNYK